MGVGGPASASFIPPLCDPHAEEVLTQAFRRMTPAQRLAMVDEMWESLRTMILCQLRSAHPDWSDDRLSSETARRMSREAAGDHAVRDGGP